MAQTKKKIIDVKVGIADTGRELVVHTEDAADDVYARVEKVLTDQTGLLTLTDDKGARTAIPVAKIAYVEVSSPDVRKVGFGAS